MDIALAIEAIYSKAEYFGATSQNTKAAYDALNWLDLRAKPTWKELETAMAGIPTEQDLVKAKATAKAALLDRLGITAEEAALLLS